MRTGSVRTGEQLERAQTCVRYSVRDFARSVYKRIYITPGPASCVCRTNAYQAVKVCSQINAVKCFLGKRKAKKSHFSVCLL